jgi:hypothetical protein
MDLSRLVALYLKVRVFVGWATSNMMSARY